MIDRIWDAFVSIFQTSLNKTKKKIRNFAPRKPAFRTNSQARAHIIRTRPGIWFSSKKKLYMEKKWVNGEPLALTTFCWAMCNEMWMTEKKPTGPLCILNIRTLRANILKNSWHFSGWRERDNTPCVHSIENADNFFNWNGIKGVN